MYQPSFIIRWLFPALYRVRGEQPLFNNIHHASSLHFTFDDGPCPETTRHILDILKRDNIHATFFVVGDNVLRYPELMREIVAAGHRIGNHTMHHTDGFKVSTRRFVEDVEECQKVISQFTDQTEKYFRPPHGHIRWSEIYRLRRLGYTIVQWDIIAHDWEADRSVESVVDIVRKYRRSGSILVLHDSAKAAARSVTALKIILSEKISNLNKKGSS